MVPPGCFNAFELLFFCLSVGGPFAWLFVNFLLILLSSDRFGHVTGKWSGRQCPYLE